MLIFPFRRPHSGEIIRGRQRLAPPTIAGDLGRFMHWVDQVWGRVCRCEWGRMCGRKVAN